MHTGLAIFTTDETIHPAALAVAAEERGFESVLFPDHTHIPVSYDSVHPRGDIDLPREYLRVNDALVAAMAAAAVTTRLKVGTCVYLAYERDPIATAKAVATIDHLSGGRMIFGVGGGWNREEMQNHGVDPSTRFARLAEHVKAMKEIWTEDEAEFHGTFVDFAPIWSWPKPVQRPHPPVLVGGSGPTVLERVVEYGDGWIPVADLTDLPSRMSELRARAADAGRDRIPVSVFRPAPDLDTLLPLREAGVERVVLGLPAAGHDDVLRVLDQHAPLVERLR